MAEISQIDVIDHYFVNTPEELELCRGIINANDITPVGYEKMRELPVEAIKNIIVQRYRKTVGKLATCYGRPVEEGLVEQLIADINLIAFLIANDYDLYSEDLNIELILGGVRLTDIIGLLNAYEEYLRNGRVNPILKRHFESGKLETLINPQTGKPYKATDYIDYVKNGAEVKKEEFAQKGL